jgi:hypothetical protein
VAAEENIAGTMVYMSPAWSRQCSDTTPHVGTHCHRLSMEARGSVQPPWRTDGVVA